MTRRHDWIFLDAGETLFKVDTPSAEFAALFEQAGFSVTTARVQRAVEQARREALTVDHLGPAPDFAVVADRAAARRERLIAAILKGLEVPAQHWQSCRAAIREAFVSAGYFSLYPEVLAVLETLRERGFRLGIISNWEPRLELLCRNHGLAEYLGFVLASEAVGYAKPGPPIFRRALELAGVPPARAIHVGDSFDHDVRGATALGIPAVLLDRGGYYPPGRWRPTIRALDELLALV